MKRKPLISIIVPVYKVEKYLDKCIRSIMSQTYDNIEIILIDDGSPDNCGIMCDAYSVNDTRIKVIHKKNGGLSSARNAGLDIANGEFIGFVDSDDYIDKDMYETLMESIHEKNEIACCGVYREKENGKYIISNTPNRRTEYNTDHTIAEILKNGDINMGVWCKLFPRDTFQNIRFPNGETNEDAAILIDLHTNKSLIHIGKPKYHYIQRFDSITSNMNVSNLMCAYKNASMIYERVTREYPSVEIDAKRYYDNMSRYIVYMYTIRDECDELYQNAYDHFIDCFWGLINMYRFKPKRVIQCFYLRLLHNKIIRDR